MEESFVEKLEKAKKYSEDLNEFTTKHWDCPVSIRDEARKAKEKYLELQNQEKLMLSKEALIELKQVDEKYFKLLLYNLKDQIQKLEDYIKREECPHVNTHDDFAYDSHYSYDLVICDDCGETISSEKT